jgi:hypothetical protein
MKDMKEISWTRCARRSHRLDLARRQVNLLDAHIGNMSTPAVGSTHPNCQAPEEGRLAERPLVRRGCWCEACSILRWECRRLRRWVVIASARFSVLRTTPKEGNEGCRDQPPASPGPSPPPDRTHARGGPGAGCGGAGGASEPGAWWSRRPAGASRRCTGRATATPRELGVGPKSRSRAESGMRARPRTAPSSRR